MFRSLPAALLLALALTGCSAGVQLPGTPPPGGTQLPPAPITAEPPAAPAALDACALLPLDLAERTIEGRSPLQTSSAPGGSECLYSSPADEPFDNLYSVDLDLIEGGSLESARAGLAQPTVVIADESGLGDGAFSAVNVTFAAVVCESDGVLYEVEVGAPPVPDAIAANSAFALGAARTLAAEYCG